MMGLPSVLPQPYAFPSSAEILLFQGLGSHGLAIAAWLEDTTLNWIVADWCLSLQVFRMLNAYISQIECQMPPKPHT